MINKLHPVGAWFRDLFAAHVASGSVSAISGSTITIQSHDGTVYVVNAANAKVYKKDGSTVAALSDIKVSDSVQVMGTVNGTSVTAEVIQDFTLQ